MIKVVADTNIYLSAILFGGKPDKIRRLAREKEIELLISEQILAEIAGILKRKFDWLDSQISQTIESIRNSTTLITPKYTLNVIKKHNPDNRILECAIEGDTQYIVSGDKHHLLPLKEWKEIKIISPSEFLEIFNKG